MNEQQKKTILRFASVFLLMLFAFLVVLWTIIRTQTVEREQWLEAAKPVIQGRPEVIMANRGNIYDCQGKLLATSIRTYNVAMDTRTEFLTQDNGKRFKDSIGFVSQELADYFQDKTAEEYKAAFMKAYNTKNRNFRFTNQVLTYDEFQVLRMMPLFRLSPSWGGLKYAERYERVKPYGSLASRTVGDILPVDRVGKSGIEKEYEAILHGVDGRSQYLVDEDYHINYTIAKSRDGEDIVTTLDVDLQDVVESQLRSIVTDMQADWGCCVLMEVETGEIKAISNLTRTKEGRYVEETNHAATAYEPGSTFKTYTLMAALDDGKIEITDSIDVENGYWVYRTIEHKDAHVYDEKHPLPQTIRKAFAVSSNVALAKIITKHYTEKSFYDKLKKMGVCEYVPVDIAGKKNLDIKPAQDMATLSSMAYGYTLKLTPLDVLMFYNAIANDGKMMRPFLVKSIQKDGKVMQDIKPEVIESSVCKASTLRDVQTCLEDVVWDNQAPGTASINPWGKKKAQSDLVRIAGKTGTAQMYLEGKGYSSTMHRMSFCGYFPIGKPKYSCICVIERPRSPKADSGMSCGGTVRKIAEKVMAYEDFIDVETLFINSDSIQKPIVKRGMQKDIRRVAKGVDVDIDYCDAEWAKVNENYEAEPLKVAEDVVPNVVGMGAKDAVFAIERTGMYVKLSGKGKVRKQSVQSGSRIIRGGTVYLELR